MANRKSRELRFEQILIPRRDGTSLRVCIYRPLAAASDLPGVLWIHGGGYVMGVPEMDMSYVRNLIQRSPCVVVSPDYALSVEKPFPAALEDCCDALRCMKSNAGNLGIRTDQLFIGGESAGGGLTAAVTLYARDKGEVNLAFQMPLYPMLDDRMQTESMRGNDAPMWNERSNAVAWEMYLGDLFGSEEVPKYAAPARESDYIGLPPAYTFVGSVDPFYDETIAYFNNLRGAGVEVKIDIYEGCFHGFDSTCPKTRVAKEATRKFLDAYEYAAKHYFAEQPRKSSTNCG